MEVVIGSKDAICRQGTSMFVFESAAASRERQIKALPSVGRRWVCRP